MRDKLSTHKKSSKGSTAASKKLSPKTARAVVAKKKPQPKPVKPSKPAKLAAARKVQVKPAPRIAPAKKAPVKARAVPARKVAAKKPPAAKAAVRKVVPAPPVKKASVKKAPVKAAPKKAVASKPGGRTSFKPPLAPKAKPKAPVIVPRRQVATQALKAFEQAVRAFNQRQYTEARQLFTNLQTQYIQEVEIISRSQTYIQVCNSRLAGSQSLPRNADEFYDRGVVALNIGDYIQAQALFEKALKLRPDDSYTLYSLAATLAQKGAAEEALACLEQAVQKQPRLRHRALNDNDFGNLREDRRFRELLGAASPFDRLEARRDVP